MIEEIVGPSHGRPDRLSQTKQVKAAKPESSAGSRQAEDTSEVAVTSELQGLIDRVKSAPTVRKERIHEVLEKLQRGELLTSETVREAAERILREGP